MILELTKQVCSLELARRLEELGCTHESLFYWNETQAQNGGWEIKFASKWSGHSFAAYTVAELGELLPLTIEVPPRISNSCKLPADLELTKEEGGYWVVRYRCEEDSFRNIGNGADTEVDARARMLIYLLEKKLITF